MLPTGRPPTLATRGMVTSPHSIASSAGVDVLRAGGSAIDAAIASASVLGVVYPHMCGVGGDAFWLVYDAASREVRYLDGGGRAAASATLERFAGRDEIPFRGILPATVTTPGAVASWWEAHTRHGKLPFKRLFDSAIELARGGYPVSARLARFIDATAAELQACPESAALFLRERGPVRRNPDLARTLQAIADGGRAGFYEGEVAAEMARYAGAHGGFFTADDLKRQGAYWETPLEGRYRDVTLYQTPPPTQGFTVLQMLKLLEPFDLRKQPFLSADHVHLLVQAKQVSYHDRDRWLADPRFADVPTGKLLSDAYLDGRRKLIDPKQALPWDRIPSYGSLAGDTVYVAAVDKEGNAASLIFSLYGIFGSCVTAGRTGVVLQNRGAYFSLDAKHPNRLEPGKVPLHTLIASLAFRNGHPWAVLGCMGADGQPQIQVQAYVGLIDFGLDIQQAVEMPRWLSGRFALGEERDTLHIEARFPAATIAELERRGHRLDRWGDWNELAGHCHGITIDPESGILAGGADPRSDGAALGY
jgi:gamma-glutamyltranspeptidase